MNSKTSYTLCTPPSQKPCEKLVHSAFDADVAKRLYLAQQKLRPVVDDVMRKATENSTLNFKASKSHYLTVQQYEDAILASQILKDVDKMISEKQNDMRMRKYNLNKFNLDKVNAKMNKFGKIYVDTSILIQLIELHATLGDIVNSTKKQYIDESNESNDLNSHSQTEISDSSISPNSNEGRDWSSDEKFNVLIMRKNNEKSKQKIRVNINRKSNNIQLKIMGSKLTENNKPQESLPLKSYSLSKNIVVMSAHGTTKSKKSDEQSNAEKLSTLPEERTSNSETNLSDVEHSTRKIKSTGSIQHDDNRSKVTDVVGARKIILNCLYDLKKVRSFLERIDIGADVQINTAILDAKDTDPTTDTEPGPSPVEEAPENQEKLPEKQRQRSASHLKSPENQNAPDKTTFATAESSKNKRDCCCDATYASDVPMELLLDAGDENASKLIICIKGKTEDEGDVQIIIRQCSECKNVGGKETSEDDDTTDGKRRSTIKASDEEGEGFTSEFAPVVPDEGASQPDEDNKEVAEETVTSDQQSDPDVLYESTEPSDIKLETTKEESKPQLDAEKSAINVIFDPNDPSKSVVEPAKKESSIKPLATDVIPEKAMTRRSSQKIRIAEEGDGFSRIKLYETTNLCFATDDGQELVISLTVRPKTGGPAPKLSLKDIFSDSTSKSEHTTPTQENNLDNIFGSDNEITVGVQDKQQYDRFIPLSRTKICSSLEFDVSVMESRSRMKNEEIKHVNPGIVVRLKELGVNNLLRACRPVKCGRASVLNEKLRKGIPYSASLTSLPLEETDADIVNQSLEMSVNKTKHSSIKDTGKTLAYCTGLGNITNNIDFTNKNMQISFAHIPTSNDSSILNNHRPLYANNWVKKKLSFYINLVHDVEINYKKVTCGIHFFEIKKYHSTRVLEKSETNPTLIKSGNKRLIDNVLAKDLQSSSDQKKIRKLVSPRHTLKDNLHSTPKHETKCANSSSSQPPNNKVISEETPEIKMQNCKEKKKFISKIPVYKYNKSNRDINEIKLPRKSYIYDVSLQSLPRDDADEMKDIGSLHNTYRINGFEKFGNNLLKHKENFNKSWLSKTKMGQNAIEKIIYNKDHESDGTKISDDSLELYFNNFFRDKYFSKLALCQKLSSSRSLKPRNKKSEYHCSRSQSQTHISDSTVNIKISSNNLSNQTQTSQQASNSKNTFENYEGYSMISQTVMFQLTRLFCEYWIKHILSNQNEENLKVTNVNKFSSSIDILRNEAVQQFFLNIKQKILEESIVNTSRLIQSQPNVEAGMDNETGSIHFNFTPTPRPSNDNILNHLISLKTIEDALQYRPVFQYNKTDKRIGISSEREKNSCDNFQNIVVTFQSSTHIKEFPKSSCVSTETGSSPPTEYSYLAGDSLIKNSENNTKCSSKQTAVDTSFNGTDGEALHYLVYQNYFSSPSMLQRVIEKSKDLFKSNSKNSKPKGALEYLNDKISPTSKACKVCGCSISKCESKSIEGPCTCKNTDDHFEKKNKKKITSETLLQKISSKQLKPKKDASKKSIGMTTFPRKADISIDVKLGSSTEQRRTRKCYCIKCEKRSADGSCYCSHCLGVFDKSVGRTPSNKEIAIQCVSSLSKETHTTENELNKISDPEKEESNLPNAFNISKGDENKLKDQTEHLVLTTEIKYEPDTNQQIENGDIETDYLSPTDNTYENVNELSPNVKIESEEEKSQFLRVRTDLNPDEDNKNNIAENEEPIPDVKEEFPGGQINHSVSFDETDIKDEETE